ncbi:unnamed protein product [Adineta ricciae]|uniref:Uncharacterized protein n=1 Tax=Adineta ricciae TaxID=249248 RepID=A0A813QCW8_ADIRI|nr:unnamed protein product [Adineta ricciae]
MNRLVSTILILVLLDLTIQSLDAWKIESALSNGQTKTNKRRSKRDFLPMPAPYPVGVCNYGELGSCDQYASHTTQVGVQLQNTINYVQQRKFFVSGLVSVPALQNGGMCFPNTNYFTCDAFDALIRGHLTIPQLSTASLIPVPTIDVEGLQSAAYIIRYGQSHILTGLGVMASIFGHILPSQLRSFNLYPLSNEMLTSGFLQQAGYLQSDCLPTALGLAASYIHYVPTNFPSSYCQLNGDIPMSVDRLINAKYVYGNYKIVTTTGMLAMQHGYVSRDVYRNFGCYPFAASAFAQTQTSEYVYQEQTQQVSFVSDLVRTGYLYSNNLLTNVGYYSVMKQFVTVENLRGLNLWPCPSTISISAFVAAGYGSYSGHLTTLGTYLYHAQYFTTDLLIRLGIHLHDDFYMYHHALNYGGYISSSYHETHSAVHSALTYPSYGIQAAQVAQYQAGSQFQSAVGGYPSVANPYSGVGGVYPAGTDAALTNGILNPGTAFAKK